MPELPEVEIVRLGLNNFITGRQIKSIDIYNPKSFPSDAILIDKHVLNANVISVKRRAKVLFINLATDYSLMIHLKMTGQLVFVSNNDRFGAGHPNDDLISSLPSKSTRVVINFSDGSKLFFNDQRKFGWIKLIKDEHINSEVFISKLGPEPLMAEFTPGVFYQRLQRRSRTSIKAAILDQSVVAGVGNIYADESLWGARIHPATLVGKLSRRSISVLCEELKYVLALSIEKGGSTDRNYVQADGKKGSYLQFARVFRREGLDCPRCGNAIVKLRVAGRGTHICPKCQKVKPN